MACALSPQSSWFLLQPKTWPETLGDGDLRQIVEAWRVLPYDRERFASEVTHRAQRRIDALTCELLVCPDVRERAEREVQPWIALRNVGLALMDLPALDREFHERHLDWAKLEVLARVVAWQHEAAWIARARALDVRSLARLALHSRPGAPPIEAAPRTCELDADEVASALGLREGSWDGLERELVQIAFGAAWSSTSKGAATRTAAPRAWRVASSLSRAAARIVASVRRIAVRVDPRRLTRTFVRPTSNLGSRDLPDVRHRRLSQLSTA